MRCLEISLAGNDLLPLPPSLRLGVSRDCTRASLARAPRLEVGVGTGRVAVVLHIVIVAVSDLGDVGLFLRPVWPSGFLQL